MGARQYAGYVNVITELGYAAGPHRVCIGHASGYASGYAPSDHPFCQ